MADRSHITRRDFLNGVALSLAAGTSLTPLQILAAAESGSPYYPPLLTGLRGSHAGSFEIGHAVALAGARFQRPTASDDTVYDLVIVGGGISGLAAAKLYRDQAGGDRKILVLDNHDDFGGHAKRNEFKFGGRTLICHGGSQSLETPGLYSAQSKAVLASIGVEPRRFYDYFDDSFHARHGLRDGVYFSKEKYGRDRVLPNVWSNRQQHQGADEVRRIVDQYPMSDKSRAALQKLLLDNEDYLAGMSQEQKVATLRGMSFSEFLRRHAAAPEEVVTFVRDTFKGYWGFGWDALSALEAYRMETPGTFGLGLQQPKDATWESDEPYIFHFPDGNAGIARLLVRDLVPGSAAGSSMEDIVTARMNYDVLDLQQNRVRIRLNATAVDVRHAEQRANVDVTYVRNGKPESVRARHCILACYNRTIPYICSEVPPAQRDAIDYAIKTPLAYISVAVHNWRAFKNLGFHQFYQPDSDLMHSFGLDFPVSMDGYRFTAHPDEPTVLHGSFAPTLPDRGLTQREQNLAGARRMLAMSFDQFEAGICRQLDGALGGGGFDSQRDVAALTVNRWPHGYAYEYNDLYDPPEYSPGNGPHIAGRARIGRISIANSDSSAYAFVDGAIDAAVRAVAEQLAL